MTTRLDLGQFHLPGRKDHEIFAGSILYTDREAKQYNNLLHFQRIKSHVVSAMVQDYCQKEGSCSRLDASVDLKSTGLSRMEEIKKDLREKDTSNRYGKLFGKLVAIAPYSLFSI